MGPVHFDVCGSRDSQQVVEDSLEDRSQILRARRLRQAPDPDVVVAVAIVQIFQAVLHVTEHKAVICLLGLDSMDSELSGLQVLI